LAQLVGFSRQADGSAVDEQVGGLGLPDDSHAELPRQRLGARWGPVPDRNLARAGVA
jgi:hypothetical protein